MTAERGPFHVFVVCPPPHTETSEHYTRAEKYETESQLRMAISSHVHDIIDAIDGAQVRSNVKHPDMQTVRDDAEKILALLDTDDDEKAHDGHNNNEEEADEWEQMESTVGSGKSTIEDLCRRVTRLKWDLLMLDLDLDYVGVYWECVVEGKRISS